MSRAVDEVKSSEPLAINCITDQCESQTDESMPAPKQYNHVGLLGILKLLAFILLKVLAVAWAFFINMQSEKQNKTKKNKKKIKHANKLIVFFFFLNGNN